MHLACEMLNDRTPYSKPNIPSISNITFFGCFFTKPNTFISFVFLTFHVTNCMNGCPVAHTKCIRSVSCVGRHEENNDLKIE